MNARRIFPMLLALIAITYLGNTATGEDNLKGYVGHWALHRSSGAGWLELHVSDGQLAGSLLWGGGSVVPLDEVACEADRVLLIRKRQTRRKNGETVTVATRWAVTLQDGQLAGTTLPNNPNSPVEKFVGKRLPDKVEAPNLAAVTYDDPIELFNGRDLTGWTLTNPGQQNGFKVVDGVLVNDPVRPADGSHGNYGNLMTTQKFEDFRLSLDVNVPEGSNSGIYLRGIYEVQVCDSYGHPVDSHNMGGLYSRITPSEAAEKPAGEWQTLDMTLCKRHLTVLLNGKKIIDNQPVQGVTGGALTADEFSPGPIYLQGDHGKVSYRNIVLRPIAKD